MDKGYFDYDYEKPTKDDLIAKNSAKSEDELEGRLKKMTALSNLFKRKDNPLTAEEIQNAVLTKINSNGIPTN